MMATTEYPESTVHHEIHRKSRGKSEKSRKVKESVRQDIKKHRRLVDGLMGLAMPHSTI